jgi:hypothetical protein
MRFGAVAMLMLGATACTDPLTLNSTALFVTAEYDAGLPITQLFFAGRLPAGSDLFTPAYRPEDAGNVLPSPQSVVVLLQSGFGGDVVTVDIAGYSATGDTVALGSATATIKEGYQVSITVPLAPPEVIVPLPDGGSGSGDGGMMSSDCSCADSCCIHFGASLGQCVKGFSPDLAKYFCGASGTTCLGCDPLTADQCTNGKGCTCGTGSACVDGLTCYEGHCVCSPLSCPGCCTAAGACVAGTDKDACGTGGLQCDVCSSAGQGGGTCTAGVCSSNLCKVLPAGVERCLSGMGCADAGELPFCAYSSSVAGATQVACTACDFHKADNCGMGGTCVCGTGTRACGGKQICANGSCDIAPDELAGVK